jgi:hypothetical protein
MGNFLFVVANEACRKEAEELFNKGLRLIPKLKGIQITPQILVQKKLWIATFSRLNGSGGNIEYNIEKGDWLFSIGTWLHIEVSGNPREQKLLDLIRTKGISRIVKELEGFFVIITGNEFGDATIVTDVIGSCHAFSRSWNGFIAISSSSLLLAALKESNIDLTACQEFINGGVIYEQRTLFQNVNKLRPATCYNISDGRLARQEEYWSLKELKPDSIDGGTAIESLKEVIQGDVCQISHINSNIVCDLTGGYDSRTLTAAFLSKGIPISTTVSGIAESPDVRVSSALARIAGLQHGILDPEPIQNFSQIRQALELTDGEYDIVEYAGVREIHRAQSEKFELSLNGSFGEVARGYWWEILIPNIGKIETIDPLRVARLRYMPRGFDRALFPAAKQIDLQDHYAAVIVRNNSGLENTPNTFQLDNAYLKLRMQRWQGRIASSTNQIWPCLSPFISKSILEIMLQVNHRLRKRSLLVRKLLPQLDSRFAEYPLEHGFPPLPVNLGTLHRFWPILPLYAGKVVRRMKRLGKMIPSSTGPTSSKARLSLWQDPQINEALNSATMLSAEVMDEEGLKHFIRRSKQPDFQQEGQWARVLTLECTLRLLKETTSLYFHGKPG